MAKPSTSNQLTVSGSSGWMTISEAADLCGVAKSELRKRIREGRLRAFTVERGKKVRYRVTRAALVDAGYLGSSPPSAAVDLLSLIREQNLRISALEDQRTQLAAQLGVAMERLRGIDQRMSDLEREHRVAAPEPIPRPVTATPNGGSHRAAEVVRRSLVRVVSTAGTGRPWKRVPGRR